MQDVTHSLWLLFIPPFCHPGNYRWLWQQLDFGHQKWKPCLVSSSVRWYFPPSWHPVRLQSLYLLERMLIWLLDILQSASKFQGPRRDELLVLRHVAGKAIQGGSGGGWGLGLQNKDISGIGKTRRRKPGGLPSLGSHRVGKDWSDLAAATEWKITFTEIRRATTKNNVKFSSVQSLSRVLLFATPWIAACQASLSITNSQSSLRLASIESVMPSSHLILCRPLLFLPLIPPNIRVFSNESTLCMRWPKFWSFSFSIIPSKENPGLISFRMDWLDLLGVQAEANLKKLL